MKKSYLLLITIIMLAAIGCGRTQTDSIQETEEIMTEITEETESNDSSTIEGIILEQSFETELDDWGSITFASIAPEGDSNQPSFVLLKDEKVIYTFPQTSKSITDIFKQVNAIKFTDFNADEKKDVLVLVQYSDGINIWNEPIIFLQENADNMMYLNYPDLSSYKIEVDTTEGVPFYRDMLLEEYLSKQYRTESISDMEGSWLDYIEYLDSLYNGNMSTEK